MNYKFYVKLSNIIGIISIVLLVYWVFVFIAISVFEFRIFKEYITDSFYFSVVGILALMLGSLIINIMLNLTRIAEKSNLDENNKHLNKTVFKSKKYGFIFGLSFPIIFCLLYLGDYLNSLNKENLLIKTAKTIISDNRKIVNKLLDYKFEEEWIVECSNILDVFSKTDENFPEISLIVTDTLENSQRFLIFNDNYHNYSDLSLLKKKDYLFKSSHEEREYLKQVFNNNKINYKYNSFKGNYELFYPISLNNKIIVLYFTQYSRYGRK